MRLGFRAFAEKNLRTGTFGRPCSRRQDTDHQENVGYADKKRETEKSLFLDVY